MGSSTMSEKLCLKWNDFQDNINTALGILRSEHEFADVTLACEDGHQVEAHKVILAASSPFFYTLLRRNKHPHPLIYMRGVKSEDLVAIVDFLCYGEANVYQENIDGFLVIAEELKLKGLSGNNMNTESEEPKIEEVLKFNLSRGTKNKQTFAKSEQVNLTTDNLEKEETQVAMVEANQVDLQALDEQIKSMMTKSKNMITYGNQTHRASICTVCGKEGQPRNIKDHIEVNHIEGVFIPCNYCEKTFRSRNAQRQHLTKDHKLKNFRVTTN